jgi:hypothetical protein
MKAPARQHYPSLQGPKRHLHPCGLSISPSHDITAYRSLARHLTYWYRRHTSKRRLPVLFIHGVGVGLYPYKNFLRDLNRQLDMGATKDSEIGIIALEIMPVSSRITHSALETEVMICEVMETMRHHGWSKFVHLSHS